MNADNADAAAANATPRQRMAAPPLHRIDHIHVFVADRVAAEDWYARVLGLKRVPALAHWAEGGGPLTLADAGGSIHLALFEDRDAARSQRDGAESIGATAARSARPASRSTIALGVDAASFRAWQAHLPAQLGRAVAVVDHGEAESLYFQDPDGNPFEITCYR
jgi:catechol 2,3-dioxygenase-like lactoylglutathione lyase family enzyme